MIHLSMKLNAMWGLLLMLCLLKVALCDDTSIENRCGNEITKLTNCLDFATGKTSEPAGSCCSSVSDIRQRDAVCLCFIVQQTHDGSPGFKSLGLQFPRMLALPGDCKIVNSSITECPSKNSTTNSVRKQKLQFEAFASAAANNTSWYVVVNTAVVQWSRIKILCYNHRFSKWIIDNVSGSWFKRRFNFLFYLTYFLLLCLSNRASKHISDLTGLLYLH